MILTALVFATALAAEEPFNFYPNFGPLSGGTDVKFMTTKLDWRLATPQVFFGGVASPTVMVVSATEMHAVTPRHAEAAADVEVRLDGKSYTSFFKFGFVRPRDQLLIPIASEVAGGYETRWTTDIFVFNDSDETISLTPNYCFSIGAFFPCQSDLVVPAHGTFKVPPRGSPEIYLNPPSDARDKLHFSVRVRNAADPLDAGSEIPLTDRFRNERVVLSDVPVSSRFRGTLRVYSVESSAPVVVRVYDEQSGALLLQRETGPWFFPTDNPVRFSVPFFDLLSSVASDRVRIEVEQPQGHIWAMLTLTDNATQRVTVLTSQ